MASKTLSKKPFDKLNLNKFLKARMAYKKECRKAEKEHRMFLTKQLINVE